VESSYGLGCLSILFEAFGVLYIVMRVFVKKLELDKFARMNISAEITFYLREDVIYMMGE
jgi:hypothetical protein